MGAVRTRTRGTSRAILGLVGATAAALAVAAGWPAPANTATPPGYTISGGGGTYTATPQGGGSGFSGSLKSVVESAAHDLSGGGGGAITFGSGLFDIGNRWFELKHISNVTFQGQGMNATVIQNNSSASADTEPFDTGSTEHLVIRDMTVNAGGPFRSTSDVIDFDGSNNTLVERVKITQSRARGIVFDGKDIVSGKARTADNNVIRDCIISGVPSHGVQFLAASRNRVEGCTITNAAGYGIQATKSSSIADQPHKQPTANVITANFIDNAGTDGININSGDGNQILGNTITNSGNVSSGRDGIRISSSDSIACDDNRVSGNRAGDNQSTKTQHWGLNIASALCHATVVGPANDFSGNISGPINDSGTGTIHISGAGDTTPPTAPSGLTGNAVGGNRVDLSWNGSSDNVAVAGYRVFRDGAQIATSPSTAYSDTTVLPGTTHNYRVVAYDTSNNSSGTSNTVVVTTPDTAPPSAPTALGGQAINGNRVDLSWNASSDNVAVTGYRIFRDGTEIGASPSTSYSDAGVQPGSTHSYHVRAYDAAGNSSAPSTSVSVTTPAPPPPPPPPPAPGQPFTATFVPSDDATVVEAQPNANFGSGALEADANPVKNVLLSFVVSGVGSGTVKSAKLRLFCINTSPSGGQIRATSGSWDESTVTWKSAPASATAAAGSLGQVSSGQWYEVDVTSLVSGEGVVSLRLATTSSDGADFASKETSTEPQLIVNGVRALDPPITTAGPLPSLTGAPGGATLASPRGSGSDAPKATIGMLGKPRKALRRKRIRVGITCAGEGCLARAKGTISVRRSRRSFKLVRSEIRLSAGAEGKLELRLSRPALAAVKRALARRGKVVVTLSVDVRYDSGQKTTLRRTFRL